MYGQWWRLPQRKKTPHRAPPCEELDPPYDIKLVFFVLKITGKSTKTAANRAALFESNMHQIFPERGVVMVKYTVLEFYTPCNISATANAREFRFCTRVGHVKS